ncbi:MAG: formate dehydrogenase accessory protein FdhE [Candidatus Geothermincolia bacterium]
MIIEISDPGVDAVREGVDLYIRQYPEFADALRLYGALMEVQQEALESIECTLEPLDEVDTEARLITGEPLLDPCDVDIDASAYREVVAGICAAISENSPAKPHFLDELAAWEGISDARLPATRDALLTGQELGFEPDAKLSDADADLVQNILWEGLVPFYRKCGSILTTNLDQSLWQKGFCPVCGGAPLMGQYRTGDGLWIVECSLCHTGWNLQRAACPFCYESQGSLDYLYLEEDPIRRANYCKACKKYVKTVDMRNSEEVVLLPLEDIVTFDLDNAAKEKGLTSASGR